MVDIPANRTGLGVDVPADCTGLGVDIPADWAGLMVDIPLVDARRTVRMGARQDGVRLSG